MKYNIQVKYQVRCDRQGAYVFLERKFLINIQNIDGNECFKWCLVRYLHPPNHHPARTTKADKDFKIEKKQKQKRELH